MGFSVSRSFRFESAHFLPHVAEGHKCRRMHGHNYRVVITVHGKGPHGGLDGRGFVVDFAEIDAVVLPIFSLIDHQVLNDTIPNPTAELIAAWVMAGVTIADVVRVYETDDCWAELAR